MEAANATGAKKIFNILSLTVICLAAILTFFYWQWRYPLYFNMYEPAFHLSTMVGFERAGGLTITDFWLAAPGWQAQRYLPFFHTIGYLLLSSGLDALTLGKFFPWIIFILSILAFWFSLKTVFNPRIAFFSLVILLSIPIWMNFSLANSPAGLVFLIFPLIFLSLAKKNYLTAGLLSLLCLSTHLIGSLSLLFLFIYALHSKKDRKPLFLILGAIALLSLPLSIIILKRIKIFHLYINNLGVSFNLSLSNLNPLKYSKWLYLEILALPGIFLSYKKKGSYLMLPSCFLAFIPLAWLTRYWKAACLLPLSMLSACFLEKIYLFIEKKSKKTIVKSAFILCFLLVSTASLTYLLFAKSSMLKKYSLLLPEKSIIQIARIIKKNTSEGDFVYINTDFKSRCFLSALSYRSTTNNPNQGALLAVSQNPVKNYKFLKKGDQRFNIYILENQTRAKKIKLPLPLLSGRLIKKIFAFLIGITAIDLFIVKRAD